MGELIMPVRLLDLTDRVGPTARRASESDMCSPPHLEDARLGVRLELNGIHRRTDKTIRRAFDCTSPYKTVVGLTGESHFRLFTLRSGHIIKGVFGMGRTTIRRTKTGTRITTRTKVGNTTVTRTSGAGKKPRTTISHRAGKTTFSRSY